MNNPAPRCQQVKALAALPLLALVLASPAGAANGPQPVTPHPLVTPAGAGSPQGPAQTAGRGERSAARLPATSGAVRALAGSVAAPATVRPAAGSSLDPARPRPARWQAPRRGASRTRTGQDLASSMAPVPANTREVGAANAAARVQPDSAGFVNAMQRYAYAEGALYQVYARPGQVTDIMLEPGEQLVGSGPVAAGDTVRWIIGDTLSGAGATARVHILVKPVRADIATNLVINTDRRTYHLELRANPGVYMAAVAWAYPEDALIALRKAREEAARGAPAAAGLDLSGLRFGYAISGSHPAWRPSRAFDDGRQVFIEFPATIAASELPPLFVTGPDGAAELVNYRVSGRYMIVDRLFESADLVLGADKRAARVHIAAHAERGR